ncbi:MAG: hypothetical protein JNK82_11675 [Myxococcaceae bacterium]|nr:hypothetical protein [Myxococcaceae bacterium]
MAGERMIEMTWTCTSCSHKNLGRYKQCQNCRNPKDGSEPYEMPADTTKAVTVTEEALLRMASAGPDWRCAYCGSDQRRSDQGCANCGASAVEGEEASDGPPAPPKGPRPAPPDFGSTWKLVLGCFGFVVLLAGMGGAMYWWKNRARDFTANVVSVKWQRNVAVERWQVVAHEGFKENLPKTAFEVRSMGQKHHHDEQVLDGYDTEYYSVDVPDGYRTESYTERVSCGQECTSSPKSCHEECKSNKNGFASCRQVCTGGGQTCRTKYCNEHRTRQVPKTRSERRSRQVPRYRAEPRYAEGFAYKNWEWQHDRDVPTEGQDVNCRWGSGGGKALAEGEKERESRTESYEVTLSYDDGKELTIRPKDEETFAKFAPQSKHVVHTEKGQLLLDGAPPP